MLCSISMVFVSVPGDSRCAVLMVEGKLTYVFFKRSFYHFNCEDVIKYS